MCQHVNVHNFTNNKKQVNNNRKTSKQTNTNTNNLSLPPSLKVTFK